MRIIDATEAVRLLREAVAIRSGQYWYVPMEGIERPLYWHGSPEDGAPGCIVGTALHAGGAGVSAESLYALDALDAPWMLNPESRKLTDSTGEPVVISEEAAEIFYTAQRWQDCGSSWGAALGCAERYAGMRSD